MKPDGVSQSDLLREIEGRSRLCPEVLDGALGGSRGIGQGNPSSDYDFFFTVTSESVAAILEGDYQLISRLLPSPHVAGLPRVVIGFGLGVNVAYRDLWLDCFFRTFNAPLNPDAWKNHIFYRGVTRPASNRNETSVAGRRIVDVAKLLDDAAASSRNGDRYDALYRLTRAMALMGREKTESMRGALVEYFPSKIIDELISDCRHS